MTVILLTIVSSIFMGIFELSKKISLKKSKIDEILFFFTFVGLILSLVFIKQAFDITLMGFLLVFIKSAVIFASFRINLIVLKKLDVGVVVPFSMLNVVFINVFSLFLFNETLSAKKVFGMVIILIGLIVLSKINQKDQKQEDEKINYKSLSLLIIASFLGSLSGIIDKISLSNNYAKSGGFLFWFMFFLCILSGIAYLKKNKRIDFKVLKTNYWIIVLGTSLAFSDMLYYSAVSIADSSISWISIIRKLSVFVSVVLASIFLKENKLFIKLIIMLFMFAGILLILLL